MKTLILLCFLILPVIATSQKIAVNETDEFTGDRIIKTEWERFTSLSEYASYFRISKVNELYFLEIKHINGKVTAINKGNLFYIKQLNGNIIELENLEYEISADSRGSIGFAGRGVQGFHLIFSLSEKQYYSLRESLVEKIRIVTNEYRIDQEIPVKKAKLFLNCLKLFSAD